MFALTHVMQSTGQQIRRTLSAYLVLGRRNLLNGLREVAFPLLFQNLIVGPPGGPLSQCEMIEMEEDVSE